jgi:hypothetical protein
VIDGADRRSPRRTTLSAVRALTLSGSLGDIQATTIDVATSITTPVAYISTALVLGNYFTFTTQSGAITNDRTVENPNADGTFALAPVIVPLSPTTSFAIAADRYTDQTRYLTPTGAVTGTLTLPTAADSRLGQIIRLWSTQTITSLTVSVSGSGTIQGTALAAGVANTPYAWQCVSVTGNGTWTRIQ